MRLVIGDVHGHYDALQILLDTASPGANDPIFLLGDLIDRGPHSDLVVKWVRRTATAQTILGNHEHMLLQVLRSLLNEPLTQEEEKMAASWVIAGNGALPTINSFGFATLAEFFNQPLAQIQDLKEWLASLPLVIESGQYVLIHAGLECEQDLIDRDSHTLLWNREWMHMEGPPIAGKSVIVGHTQTWALRHWVKKFEPGSLIGGNGWLNIDTGSQIHGRAWLTGLDLNTKQVFQVNLDSLEARINPLDRVLKQFKS